MAMKAVAAKKQNTIKASVRAPEAKAQTLWAMRLKKAIAIAWVLVAMSWPCRILWEWFAGLYQV